MRLGWSRARAARELGCGRQSITDWEAGARPVPRSIGLACAAINLGIGPDWIKTLDPEG